MTANRNNDDGGVIGRDTLQLAGDFDRWIQLAQFYAKRHDERRNYEWKIILGFWAAIFGTVYKGFDFPEMPYSYWPVVFAFFVVFWLYGTWFANREDKKRHEFAIRSATCTQDSEFRDSDGRNPFTDREYRGNVRVIREFLRDWARVFQLVATGGLMWLAWGTPTRDSVILAVLVAAISFPVGYEVGFCQASRDCTTAAPH